mgnify:CR=1 FL=1
MKFKCVNCNDEIKLTTELWLIPCCGAIEVMNNE